VIMQVRWYGHACFRLEAGGTSVITDPFTPETSGLRCVTDTATYVVRSSTDDDFHCNAAMIGGEPTVLDAPALVACGPFAVDGLRVTAFSAMESLDKDEPRLNAMYCCELGGLRVLHMGDLGNPFSREQLGVLQGRVDVVLALAGGPPTIGLDDLVAGLAVIAPRVIIPMHYRIPGIRGDFGEVEDLLSRYEADEVTRVEGSEMDLEPGALPDLTHLYVLEPSC